MITCPACDTRIIWGFTERKRPLPLDWQPSDAGTLAISERAGRVSIRYLRGSDAGCLQGEWRATCHLDTCTSGERLRSIDLMVAYAMRGEATAAGNTARS